MPQYQAKSDSLMTTSAGIQNTQAETNGMAMTIPHAQHYNYIVSFFFCFHFTFTLSCTLLLVLCFFEKILTIWLQATLAYAGMQDLLYIIMPVLITSFTYIRF